MDSYCKNFVEEIFEKHDKDASGILERKELKNWIREELKTHKYFKKETVKRDHNDFFSKVDVSGDGKIDRWELYNYCLNNMRND